MGQREETERLVRDAYAARKRGDIDTILQLFDGDAEFRLAGTSTTSPVAVRTVGREPFRKLLGELIQVFQWLDHEIVSMVIDGERVAVHSRARMRSSVTGDTVDTELMDLIEVKNGRISSFLQFCDTALAARLMRS